MTSLRVRTVALDSSPALLSYLRPDDGLLWLRDGEGLVAWGEVLRVETGSGPARFADAEATLADLIRAADVEDEVQVPGTGLVAFGAFTFDPRAHGSTLVVPQVVVGCRRGQAWLTVVGDAQPDLDAVRRLASADSGKRDRVRYAGSSLPDVHWLEAVAGAIERIDSGALDKVVLARDYGVWSKTPFDPVVLAARLSARFPNCFTFVCDGLVGATPELLVRRTGADVEALVLAGSAPRGADGASDEMLGEDLLSSKKDRAEHEFAVESVRDTLAPRCAQLHVAQEPALLRLDNVQHLATRVTGTAHGDASALALAGALHPTAAVCGVPTDAALALIRELEGMDRGRYSGPVGWVDARGDGEWGIALRCAELSGARARLFAGAGIVAGSLPEAELEETRLKLRAMQSAFED